MAQYGLNFGQPANFADWSQYAGFDPNKPIIGIAPPSSKGAVMPTMSQVGQRVSDIGTQLGQGNILNAVKTFQGGAAPVAAVAKTTPAPIDKDGDGMISDWEE